MSLAPAIGWDSRPRDSLGWNPAATVSQRGRGRGDGRDGGRRGGRPSLQTTIPEVRQHMNKILGLYLTRYDLSLGPCVVQRRQK